MTEVLMALRQAGRLVRGAILPLAACTPCDRSGSQDVAQNLDPEPLDLGPGPA